MFQQDRSYLPHSSSAGNGRGTRLSGIAATVFGFFAATLAIVFIGVAYNQHGGVLSNNHISTTDHVLNGKSSTTLSKSTSSLSISFDVQNEYNQKPGLDYPWIKVPVVEPYKTSGFSATASEDDDKWTYQWTIDGTAYTGQRVEHTFTGLGTFVVTVSAYNVDGVEKATYTSDVICKYVRREIRTLTDQDRDMFFDTALVLYQVETTEGQLKYGANYKDINYFTRIHNTLAGDKECDHMHNGLGFLTNHGALTAEFEASLQAVNPSVTVPYWDYTIEAHYVYESGRFKSWRESPVFGSDYFGEAAPEGKVVKDGRFAYTTVMSKASSFCPVTNAFDLLRSPWNMNSIPYITRYDKVYGFEMTDSPGCSHYYDQMKLKKWYEFGMEIANLPHGTVHTIVGGVWGANYASKLLEAEYDYDLGREFGLEAFAWQKNMWRADILTCPGVGDSACNLGDSSVDVSGCKCACPNLDTYIQSGEAGSLLATIAPPLFTNAENRKNKNGVDISDTLLRLLCNDYDDINPSIGDSLESASPADISFWPTHPAVERLWQWRRLNGMSSDEWVDNTATSVEGTKTGYCYGHNADDVLIWSKPGVTVTDDDVSTTSITTDSSDYYTNAELYAMMDPREDQLPYIYDTFNWDHCGEEGYPVQLLEGDDGTQNGPAADADGEGKGEGGSGDLGHYHTSSSSSSGAPDAGPKH